MTHYEFLDYALGVGTNVSENAMSFVTVLFAYIVCAYLVGRKITILQSVGLTVVYSTFSLLTILGIFSTIEEFYKVSLQYQEYSEGHDRVKLYLYGGPGSLLVAWVLSIAYMVGENWKPSKEGAI